MPGLFERIKKIVSGALFVLFFLSSPAPAEGDEIQQLQRRIESQEEELSAAENEIQHLRSGLQKLGEREEKLSAKLNEIDKEIDGQRTRLERLGGDIKEVNRQISEAEGKIRSQQRQKSGYQTDLEKLNRAYYYESGRNAAGWISYFFGGGPGNAYLLAGMMSVPAVKYLRKENEIETIISQAEELREKNRRLGALKEQVVGLQEEFIDKRKEQINILNRLQSRRRQQRAKLQEKEREKEQLRQLIESLRYEARSRERLKELAEDFAAGKGALPWPLRGEVVSRFGRQRHPSLDTYIYNRGIEMKISPGSQVKAVAGGEVVFADIFRNKGSMVVIDHGNDYYTIYGGLENILTEVGYVLDPLDVVGKSSDNFYFELGRGSEPEDPLRWLE